MMNLDYVIKSDIQSVVVRFNKVPFAIFFWWKTLIEVLMQDFVGMSTFIFVLELVNLEGYYFVYQLA